MIKKDINKRYGNYQQRCILRAEDLLFAKLLITIFKCLRVGTIAYRAQNLAEITLLLHPDFMFNEYSSDTKIENLEYIRRKGFRMFFMPMSIQQRIEKNKRESPTKVVKAIKTVTEFYKLKKDFIKNSPIFIKFKMFDNTETQDLLNGK